MDQARDLEAQVIDLIKSDRIIVPPYPVVAMRLQQLVSSDDYGIKDLQRIIGGDPILAATVLRYANSAAFAGLNQAATLDSALGRIGAKEVCNIALATSIGANAIVAGSLSRLRRQYWRLSLMSAMLCRSLAHWRKQNPDEAFICGLLHDFGQIVATACLEEILSRANDNRILPESAWTACVDRFHVELGLVTAARWNLPPLIVGVIMAHHDPASDPAHLGMLDVVNTCDAIASRLHENASPTGLAELGLLSEGELAHLVTDIPRMALEIAALDEATPGRDTGLFRVPSCLPPPASILTGPTKPAALRMHVLRSSGSTSYDTAYLAKDGVGFVGASKLRENSMVRFRVEAPQGPIDALGTVAVCGSKGAEHRMEAKLFAADARVLQAWQRCYSALA